MRTITLQLDGGPLVVDVYDPPLPPNSPPVVLIHGWGGSGRYWRTLIDRLCPRYQLIVPDLPGVARSMPVQRPFGLHDLLLAVETLVDHLQVEEVYVVGHSMGSGIGILLAARRPELVRRLVLTSLSLFKNEAERRIFGAAMEVAAVGMRLRGRWMAGVPLLAKLSARRGFYRVPDDAALLRDLFEDYLTMDYGTALACARDAGSRLVVDAAGRVRAPMLLVVAREDRLMPPANVPHTARVLGDCQVHWLSGCGHLPMVERPDVYGEVVETFLEAGSAAPGASLLSVCLGGYAAQTNRQNQIEA
jgi:pimeloyl-ACP methyl ester carboxylesterase